MTNVSMYQQLHTVVRSVFHGEEVGKLSWSPISKDPVDLVDRVCGVYNHPELETSTLSRPWRGAHTPPRLPPSVSFIMGRRAKKAPVRLYQTL